jgi:hypothetical protein
MKRTLIAIGVAVLLSLMLVPDSGQSFFQQHAHPFFMAEHINTEQLVLQTIFLAVLFAVIVSATTRWLGYESNKETFCLVLKSNY